MAGDLKIDPQKTWVPIAAVVSLLLATGTGVAYAMAIKGTAEMANERSIKVETRQDAAEVTIQNISESNVRIETKLDIILEQARGVATKK